MKKKGKRSQPVERTLGACKPNRRDASDNCRGMGKPATANREIHNGFPTKKTPKTPYMFAKGNQPEQLSNTLWNSKFG